MPCVVMNQLKQQGQTPQNSGNKFIRGAQRASLFSVIRAVIACGCMDLYGALCAQPPERIQQKRPRILKRFGAFSKLRLIGPVLLTFVDKVRGFARAPAMSGMTRASWPLHH